VRNVFWTAPLAGKPRCKRDSSFLEAPSVGSSPFVPPFRVGQIW
jgi:hypothetical protein